MTLMDWQSRLQAHFEKLSRDRTPKVSGVPLFALEHGLSGQELRDVENNILAHIKEYPPAKKHWLAWIVYACEIGYEYSGDEYWQTFEQRTPGWVENGNRYIIRSFFRNFHLEFGGVKPTGTWASHFSIICWPITHAILPKDLQIQLAKVLYEARHRYNAEVLGSAEKLGNLIAAYSWRTTSRFRNFVQQPLLVGHIAKSLLFHEEQTKQSLILPQTLKRIVTDLDRVRRARIWLKDAQKSAQRMKVFGLASGRYTIGTDRVSEYGPRELVEALGIEPRIILRPTTPASWDLLLELPDFKALQLKFPQLGDILSNSRCCVVGSSERPLARGWLLYGPQRIPIRKWPKSDDPLLRFDNSAPELDYLLRTECLLRPGPIWLCRIASDGLAYEVRGQVVRPGCQYIIISSGDPVASGPFSSPTSITCEGLHALRLDLPDAVSSECSAYLSILGLNQAKSVRVWPVGLTARSWDGEGYAEWLSSDQPCIAIQADHPIDTITVELDGNGSTKITKESVSPSQPLFLKLPALPSGIYQLRVLMSESEENTEEDLGSLSIEIREPLAWITGQSCQCALLVFTHPNAPSLEDLWEGRVEIEIHGPLGRKIGSAVSFFDHESGNLLMRKELPPIALPVASSSWESHFEKHFLRSNEAQRYYDLTKSFQLDFDGQELGTYSLTGEREFTHVRWVVQLGPRSRSLRLIDDSGSEDPLQLYHYTFSSPDVSCDLCSETATKEQSIPEPGGLYLACCGEYQRAVIVPPVIRTLHDLDIRPKLRSRHRTANAILDLVASMELWANARLTGQLACRMGQRRVLLKLVMEIFGIVCGKRWAQKEQAFLRQHDKERGLLELKREISSKPQEKVLGSVLTQRLAELFEVTPTERVATLSSLVQRFLKLPKPAYTVKPSRRSDVILLKTVNPDRRHWISEFALRLASSPESIRQWADKDFEAGIERILEVPVLAKMARFIVLAIDHKKEPKPIQSTPIYAGWRWE